MENDIYPWHAEMMTSYRMSEVMRETEKIQLLHDAGLYNPGFLDRLAIALEKRLIKLGLRIRKNYTQPQRAYEVTSSKFAA